MSQIDPRFVKRGLWTNLDKGPVMGKTITTDIHTGTIVIALLAVLASIALTHLWNLIIFLCHQLRANGKPADGLSRQQQVMYRSSPTPNDLLADTLKLWWLWRKRTHRAWVRSVVPFGLSALFSAGIVIVGIFSSYVVDSTNLEVLVSSPFCGPLNINPLAADATDALIGLEKSFAKINAIARTYVSNCYQNETSLPSSCSVFIKPNIPLEKARVDCPFESSICADPLDGEPPAVRIDSGLVDMNEGLGWNMATEDKVKFRKSTTCAILRLEGRTRVINATDYTNPGRPLFPGEEALILEYGEIQYGAGVENETFAQSLLRANISKVFETDAVFKAANPGNTISQFDPIPQLQMAEADLVLVRMMRNRVIFSIPVNDPFFAAHKTFEMEQYWNGETETMYYADFPSSVMGCAQQYQFCFARNGASDFCTELGPLPASIEAEEFPGASQVQLAVLKMLMTSSVMYDMYTGAVDGSRAQTLNGESGYLHSLPDDQWIQEVAGWESFAWAGLQIVMADYAIGPSVRDPSAAAYMRNETSSGERQLCQMQRMKSSGGFVNINVFGLAFIVAFACVVTILDMVLLKFCIYLSRFRRALSPRIDRWIQDGVFQLQRRAYEAHGEGTWDGLKNEIPVTNARQELHELSVESGADALDVDVKLGRMQTFATLVSESSDGKDRFKEWPLEEDSSGSLPKK